MYSITKNFIPGLPQTPYDGGVRAYQGVIMHSTAMYEDTSLGERNYELTHWAEAFVHFFTDDKMILQVADTNYIAYGAGKTANHKGMIHSELCQSKNHDKFLAAYKQWIWLAAKLLYDKKLGVIDNQTLFSHQEITNNFHETDHQDPIAYLKEHGKTWNDVVNDVKEVYESMDNENKPQEVPQWKNKGAEFLCAMEFTDVKHDPLEVVDFGTLGKILNKFSLKYEDWVRNVIRNTK
jgi:N-acetylmuramoyl-L-alanine amidase